MVKHTQVTVFVLLVLKKEEFEGGHKGQETWIRDFRNVSSFLFISAFISIRNGKRKPPSVILRSCAEGRGSLSEAEGLPRAQGSPRCPQHESKQRLRLYILSHPFAFAAAGFFFLSLNLTVAFAVSVRAEAAHQLKEDDSW